MGLLGFASSSGTLPAAGSCQGMAEAGPHATVPPAPPSPRMLLWGTEPSLGGAAATLLANPRFILVRLASSSASPSLGQPAAMGLGTVVASGACPAVPTALMPSVPCLQAARVPLPAGAPPVMAIVQTLPVPLEAIAEGAAQLRAAAHSPPATMGSVSSLLPGRPRHDHASQPCDGDPPTASFRKPEGLLRATQRDPPSPEESHPAMPGVTHAYANGGFCGDWLDVPSPTSPCSDSDEPRDDQAPSCHLRGPPPKLVPVSGKLEEVGRGEQRGG